MLWLNVIQDKYKRFCIHLTQLVSNRCFAGWSNSIAGHGEAILFSVVYQILEISCLH